MNHPLFTSLLLQAVPVVEEPFNPGLKDWVAFGVINALIVTIYVIRYLASNRKKHTYIQFADEQEKETGTRDGA